MRYINAIYETEDLIFGSSVDSVDYELANSIALL